MTPSMQLTLVVCPWTHLGVDILLLRKVLLPKQIIVSKQRLLQVNCLKRVRFFPQHPVQGIWNRDLYNRHNRLQRRHSHWCCRCTFFRFIDGRISDCGHCNIPFRKIICRRIEIVCLLLRRTTMLRISRWCSGVYNDNSSAAHNNTGVVTRLLYCTAFSTGCVCEFNYVVTGIGSIGSILHRCIFRLYSVIPRNNRQLSNGICVCGGRCRVLFR